VLLDCLAPSGNAFPKATRRWAFSMGNTGVC